MFTMDLSPGSFNHIVSPREKLSPEPFKDRAKKRDHFYCVKRQFGIEVQMSKCVHKEVHQRLHPTRVFMIKH
jgi:hypothetical protein